MKKITTILLIVFAFTSYKATSQVLEKPTEGKSLVYIMRSNNLGAGLNFRVYDKDKFLGALPSGAYFIYECDPGEHLFWAASENRDFVEANLEANKTYVIDLRAKMGMFIAAVGVEPYEPTNKKHVKRIKKVLRKHINANVVNADKTEEKEDNIAKAMEAYDRIKDKENSKIKKLLSNMNFENK
ncbi:hypothetical protein [Olleya sp. YS]|uniref:hypothetical protein n=1 Tax=Olleya sp. YS TaxID=3028318 RepID=UPI00243442BF|nr:hypothetical protein [Olleya sp. YS]WGD35592.1 hypothetical protein Ollyesu_04090 [Olleya sp. YS]